MRSSEYSFLPGKSWARLCRSLERLPSDTRGISEQSREKARRKPNARVRDAESFHAGKISEIFHDRRFQKLDQAKYYLLWLKSLPYHRFYSPLRDEELAVFHEERFFIAKAYRLRSLKGTLHPDDIRSIRPTEFADRLYLWVWKWLLNPDDFPIHKVTTQIQNLNLAGEAHRMTAEDSYLIRNSLLWLGLLDPLHEKSLLEKLAALRGQFAVGLPVFELESSFIHYCRALRDGHESLARDLLAEIEGRIPSHNKDLHFHAMAKALGGKTVAIAEPLRPFLWHLRNAIRPIETGRKGLTVDLTLFKLSEPASKEKKKPVYSRPMALAMDLLRQSGGASVEEICRICFGITRFEPLIHMPRVYNLLARLNALKTSKLRFRVRDGLVVTDGDWSSVAFLRDGALSKSLSRQREWANFLSEASPEEPAVLKPPVLPKKKSVYWEGYLKRADVETLINRPRSTTNRILTGLVQKGLVVREGGARHARYRLKYLSEIQLEEFG